MKAPAFDYHRAASLAEALDLLAEHGDEAKLVAGGQSLIPALNLRLLAPSLLIDVGGLPELRGIAETEAGLRLGALTRHVEVERDPRVRAGAPLLADAARHVAHPAIRSRGTLGGSLAQADPASEFPACAVAMGAEIVALSKGGERRIAAEEFITGVFETALAPGEILAAVEVPRPGPNRRHVFLELARRSGDYALVGLACAAEVADGRLADLRAVFLAAGPGPVLAKSAAAELVGADVTEAALARAAAALGHDLSPDADLQVSAAMRLHLARTLLRRAVAALLPEAGLGQPAERAA